MEGEKYFSIKQIQNPHLQHFKANYQAFTMHQTAPSDSKKNERVIELIL
ncbi:hypothetical protein [Nafulsella turpanensis]|nr:hypothetical protein [Nafulsella turpanensis]